MGKNSDGIDVQSLTVRLVQSASVTNTSGEVSFPDTLVSVLRELSFFNAHPELIQEFPINGDERGRRIVMALAPGAGTACVVLTGHYDVVDTSNYGALEPFAFDPENLAKKMLQSLSSKQKPSPSEVLLKRDLESASFIPGRGMLDMKSGLAAGIAALADFLGENERSGNIIYMAVPDEEGSSVGMKTAKKILSAFASEHGLRLKALINLDAAVDQGDGAEAKAVFLGSVSKLLPFVLFVGKPAHAGAPFDGFNPVMAASVFAREAECNSECLNIRTIFPGEEPPPPTILYYREMRSRYDVTMPADVFCALNVLTFEKSPAKVFENLKLLVQKALDSSISLLYERMSAFSRKQNEHVAMQKLSSEVLDLPELINRAEYVAPGILERLRRIAEKNFPEDKVLQTAKIVHELLTYTQIEGPCAVVGLAPPYYAKAELNPERDQAFLAYIKDEIAQFNRDHEESIKLRPYFPGISDMSFLAPSVDQQSIEYIKQRSAVDQPDLDGYLRDPLEIPVINIGPWGREYHQSGERVNRHYAFNILPDLVFQICQGLLKDNV
jgi:arginine utilization protein RocB